MDGVVDHKEFSKVLKAQVRRDEGSRVRNMKGKVASAGVSESKWDYLQLSNHAIELMKHFFGENLDKTLSYQEFAAYLHGLQREVLKREISTIYYY